MKKNIIALAVAATFAAPMAVQAAPTIYGQINANFNQTTDHGIDINSTKSRIGIKGSSDLGNGLKAVYKAEFGMTAIADNFKPGSTDKKLSPFSNRNQFVGLAGGFGTVLMGRHDTPFRMSQPKDILGGGAADIDPLSGGLGVFGKGGEIRTPEVVAYVSPAMSGITFVIAGVSNAAALDDQSPLNTVSMAAMYGSKKKGLFLSGAYNSFSEDVTGGDAATEMRLSAQYKAAGLLVSAMYQDFDKVVAGKDGSNIQLQAAYKMGKMTPKFKYSMIDYDDFDASNAFALGLSYSLGKKTGATVYYVQFDDKLKTGMNDKQRLILSLTHKF